MNSIASIVRDSDQRYKEKKLKAKLIKKQQKAR